MGQGINLKKKKKSVTEDFQTVRHRHQSAVRKVVWMCVVRGLCWDSVQGCAQDFYTSYSFGHLRNQASLDSGMRSHNIFSLFKIDTHSTGAHEAAEKRT